MKKKAPRLVWECIEHPDAEQRIREAYHLLLAPLFEKEANEN